MICAPGYTCTAGGGGGGGGCWLGGRVKSVLMKSRVSFVVLKFTEDMEYNLLHLTDTRK